MKTFISLLLLSCFAIEFSTTSLPNKAKKLKVNNRPIIAVLAQRYPKESNQSYIAASYVKYLESAGARVVPIPHYYSKEKVAELFKYVNGVLFPGGGIKWFIADYYKNAKHFWEMAIEANNKGNHFPVWATCLGFEAIHVIQTNKVCTTRREASDVANYLNFTAAAKHSRLFKGMPKDLYKAMATEDITYNHHNYGITPETYKTEPKLNKMFKILSLNDDVHGKKYVSTLEAFNYPFYGVQWHPEKHNFEFTTHFKNIPHTRNAVRVSQYMVNFFVDEARKNFQKFPSLKMEDKYLIYRYKPIHSRLVLKEGSMSHFEQCYVFKK